MNYLVVVAHPDDEVLGAGGAIFELLTAGHNVDCCILSGEVDARYKRPDLKTLHDNIYEAKHILGYRSLTLGSFPNISFNTVPHLDLVQFIEAAIAASQADVILTHHPHDLNNDHLHTSKACMAASRLWQRRPQVKQLKAMYMMEIPSSTEWAYGGVEPSFTPTAFLELSHAALTAKLSALNAYSGVMRKPPHPRSNENLTALARYRGMQSGFKIAESFQQVYGSIL